MQAMTPNIVVLTVFSAKKNGILFREQDIDLNMVFKLLI
jgi:hypothetical protein